MRMFAFLVLFTAGCATATNVNVPKETKVQVSTSCVKEKPKKPEIRSESDLMAMDRNRRTLAAYSDLRKLETYAAEQEAVIEACASLPPP